MRRISAIALGMIAASTYSEEPIDEIVVVATRTEHVMFALPYTISRIDRDELTATFTRSMPQAFRDIPGIMVQETSFGQGSPYIRGFTGFHNVFLIDGIRMNNSALRDGPNQYWSTVDSFSVDHLEVIKASASTLYGSDAVGGTVDARTPDPMQAESRLFLRGSSAEQSAIARLELQASVGHRSAVWFGVTSKHFGDLEGGSDVGLQPGVGYDEQGADLKWTTSFNNGWRLDALAQRVNQTDVPRTHRTALAKSWLGTSIGSDLKRDLDQERRLAYLRISSPTLQGVIDSATFTLSTARTGEERDRIRSNGNQEWQGFTVDTLGVIAQFNSATRFGKLTYGIDYYRDSVDSFSSRNPIQGPIADDARYSSFDVFVQDQLALSDSTIAIIGVRHTRVAIDARSVLHPTTGEQVTLIANRSATVFSGRVAFQPDDSMTLYAGISEAFRAPNLSDLTRFDSSRTNEFEVPAPGLSPESYLSFETGVKWTGYQFDMNAAVFRTLIENQIQRFPTGNILSGEAEITKANIGEGWVHGIELSFEHTWSTAVSTFGALTWIDGMVETFPTSTQVLVDEPPSRLMPPTALLGLRWQDSDRLWIEAVARFAHRQDKLSTRDATDSSRIPVGGTPGYGTVDLSAGYSINESIQLTLGIANLGDLDYRVHGSGTNMPGRNFLMAVEARF